MPLPGNANLGREKCNQNCENAVPVLGPFFGPRFFYRPYMMFQFWGPKKVPKIGPQSDDGNVFFPFFVENFAGYVCTAARFVGLDGAPSGCPFLHERLLETPQKSEHHCSFIRLTRFEHLHKNTKPVRAIVQKTAAETLFFGTICGPRFGYQI